MKKLSILLLAFTIFSCSKESQSFIKYSVGEIANEKNTTKYSIKNLDTLITIEFKQNDSSYYGFNFKNKNGKKSCECYTRYNKNKIEYTSYFTKNLIGNFDIIDNKITAKYSGSVCTIELSNYQL